MRVTRFLYFVFFLFWREQSLFRVEREKNKQDGNKRHFGIEEVAALASGTIGIFFFSKDNETLLASGLSSISDSFYFICIFLKLKTFEMDVWGG